MRWKSINNNKKVQDHDDLPEEAEHEDCDEEIGQESRKVADSKERVEEEEEAKAARQMNEVKAAAEEIENICRAKVANQEAAAFECQGQQQEEADDDEEATENHRSSQQQQQKSRGVNRKRSRSEQEREAVSAGRGPFFSSLGIRVYIDSVISFLCSFIVPPPVCSISPLDADSVTDEAEQPNAKKLKIASLSPVDTLLSSASSSSTFSSISLRSSPPPDATLAMISEPLSLAQSAAASSASLLSASLPPRSVSGPGQLLQGRGGIDSMRSLMQKKHKLNQAQSLSPSFY